MSVKVDRCGGGEVKIIFGEYIFHKNNYLRIYKKGNLSFGTACITQLIF